jgi:hypothetical protein
VNRIDFTGVIGASRGVGVPLPPASYANGRMPNIACYEADPTPTSSGAMVWLLVSQSVFGTTIENTACGIVFSSSGVATAVMVNSVVGYRYYIIAVW